MAQKIVAGRAPSPGADPVTIKVDQVLVSRHAARTLQAMEGGSKVVPETVVAYDGCCIEPGASVLPEADLLACGFTVGRAGAGFPGPVHLERFASPGRLCVTDDPRAAGVGGAGMLSLVLETPELGKALATGNVTMRVPRSVQVLFTGKARPWVSAKDIALEIVRRGVGDIVRRIAERHEAPVVLELAGAAARLFSVGDRAVIAGIAPHLGAAAALFASDDRTKDFLGDQRRSKAYRVLAPDAGAPCDDVVSIDIGTVDTLVLDESGAARSVRELSGRKVSQVVLGGDSGTTLRDLFTASVLLKSKKVPPDLHFLLAVPSRQQLEVLSASGALADLVATGARLVEPDSRLSDGTLYPPPKEGVSLRTMEPSGTGTGRAPFVSASVETVAYAVATGEVGDPRGFKRPVRGVTMPRTLPTDDVLIVRR